MLAFHWHCNNLLFFSLLLPTGCRTIDWWLVLNTSEKFAAHISCAATQIGFVGVGQYWQRCFSIERIFRVNFVVHNFRMNKMPFKVQPKRFAPSFVPHQMTNARAHTHKNQHSIHFDGRVCVCDSIRAHTLASVSASIERQVLHWMSYIIAVIYFSLHH